MQPVETRTIDELITLYQFEPTIRDVFVEGPSDANILRWALKNNVNSCNVYDIGCIEFPSQRLAELSQENSNRGRVIGLSLETADISAASNQLTFVIDCDMDRHLGITHKNDRILLTDFTCMEMYLFSSTTVEKLLTVTLGGFPEQADKLLEKLIPTLRKLFAIRLTARQMRLSIKWISFTKRCKISKAFDIEFDSNQHIQIYLGNSLSPPLAKEFIDLTESFSIKSDEDPRAVIHGHDFVELLSWYLHQRGAKGSYAASDNLCRALWSCAEKDTLIQHSLFQELIKRLS